MIYTIHKGKHRSWPFIFGLQLKLWIERDVVFDDTAAYDLPEEDIDDVNKLFGFGYINGGHHKDSARFGWNYNNETGRIRLFAYCYTNGLRSMHEICEILPHRPVLCQIDKIGNVYSFTVADPHNVGRIGDVPEFEKLKYQLTTND